MTPLQAMQAATIEGARLMGRQERVGSIEAGKSADLVAVPGDPTADITELERGEVCDEGVATYSRMSSSNLAAARLLG